MSIRRRDFLTLAAAAPLAWGPAPLAFAVARDPLVVATGMASGEAPPATRGAYEQAIRDGADILAANLFPTKEGVLVVRPSHELSTSTDIATRAEFAARKQRRAVGQVTAEGWFTEDFTLAELRTLVCGDAGKRRAGAPVDPARGILTFEDLTAVARAGCVRTGRTIGVQAAISHSAYFSGLDLAVEPRLADSIRTTGYNARAAAMVVASAEPDALRTIGEMTRVRRVLRVSAGGPPPSLSAVHGVAESIAPDASLLIDVSQPKAPAPTPLIAEAHAVGLGVQAWAAGAGFPPAPMRPGDARRLMSILYAAGVEAVAGDQAGTVARARSDILPRDSD